MKALILVLFTLPALAQAGGTITLTPGTSTNVNGIQVYCDGGAPEKQLFVCDCYNTGRTDNPPPVKAFLRVNDITEVAIESRRACGRAVYGEATHLWGFAEPRNCRPSRFDR